MMIRDIVNTLIMALFLFMFTLILCLAYPQDELPDALSFDDVPPDHWAYDEIELIASYGITVGCSYEPPLYCPERAATRAELAVMLARVMELSD